MQAFFYPRPSDPAFKNSLTARGQFKHIAALKSFSTLKDGDLVYVPRSVIGDVNEFIEVLTPSLDLLMNYPSGFRDAYALDPNKLRW